jgi:hypothetical protein
MVTRRRFAREWKLLVRGRNCRRTFGVYRAPVCEFAISMIDPRFNKAGARLGLILLTGLVAAGCGTLKTRADAVRITASAADVAPCERKGLVLLGTYDSEFRERTRDLKVETARQGGNVLLVTSFATATSGTAYVCESIDERRLAS